MAVRSHLGDRTRRAIRFAMTMAVATLLAAPLLGGNAYGAWLRVVAPEVVHMCSCGMKAGTCGCPECELRERQRLDERAPNPYPVLRSQCDGDAEVLPTSTVPPCAVTPAGFVVAPSEPLLLADRPLSAPLSRERIEPSKPPPRSRRA